MTGYNHYLHRKIRNKVNRCLYCGRITDLEIHHIDGDITNNNFNNISVLCSYCHQTKAHIVIRDSRGRFINKYINKNFPVISYSKVMI